MRKLRKEDKKRIAYKKMNYLLNLAFKTHDRNLAINAVKTAKTLSTKFRLKIPKLIRRRICKHCNNIFNGSTSLRVRIKKNLVEYFCLNCHKKSRFPFVKEKSKKSE